MNKTGTVSLFEQQSAAINIDCATVCVSSGKEQQKLYFGSLFFLYIRLNITTRKKLKAFA